MNHFLRLLQRGGEGRQPASRGSEQRWDLAWASERGAGAWRAGQGGEGIPRGGWLQHQQGSLPPIPCRPPPSPQAIPLSPLDSGRDFWRRQVLESWSRLTYEPEEPLPSPLHAWMPPDLQPSAYPHHHPWGPAELRRGVGRGGGVPSGGGSRPRCSIKSEVSRE